MFTVTSKPGRPGNDGRQQQQQLLLLLLLIIITIIIVIIITTSTSTSTHTQTHTQTHTPTQNNKEQYTRIPASNDKHTALAATNHSEIIQAFTTEKTYFLYNSDVICTTLDPRQQCLYASVYRILSVTLK